MQHKTPLPRSTKRQPTKNNLPTENNQTFQFESDALNRAPLLFYPKIAPMQKQAVFRRNLQWGGHYSNVHLAMHFRYRSVGTQRNHTACNVLLFFRPLDASIKGVAIVMHAMGVLPFRSVCAQRNHTACNVSFIFGAHHMQAYCAPNIKETPSQVRVFALAGAIGIEPTQWESEAQVLPLHQAPSRELLYITKDCFAIDFLCRNKKITAQMIFFEIIDLFLLQK